MINNQASYALLINWVVILLVIGYLPTMVRKAKFDHIIDKQAITIIKAVLISYLIISMSAVFTTYLSLYISGLLSR